MKVSNLVLNKNGLVSFVTVEDSYTMTIENFYRALYRGVFACDLVDVTLYSLDDLEAFTADLVQVLTIKTIKVKASSSLTEKTIRTICNEIGLNMAFDKFYVKQTVHYFYNINGVDFPNAKTALQYIKSLGYKIIVTDGSSWSKEI
jgi:hypothetical protein